MPPVHRPVPALVVDLPLSPAGTAAALAWVGFSHSLIDRRRLVRWWTENTGQRGYLAHGAP